MLAIGYLAQYAYSRPLLVFPFSTETKGKRVADFRGKSRMLSTFVLGADTFTFTLLLLSFQ